MRSPGRDKSAVWHLSSRRSSIEREGDGYVALCPELDIASQGDTVEAARANLVEALPLFFETADPVEVQSRLHTEVFVTRVEVPVEPRSIIRQSGLPRRLFETD